MRCTSVVLLALAVVGLSTSAWAGTKYKANLVPVGVLDPNDPNAIELLGTYVEPSFGYVELRPPYTIFDEAGDIWVPEARAWTVAARGEVKRLVFGEYTDGAGLPIVRNGNDVIPVGMLDGSTAAEQLSNLARDMRRWSPFEVALRKTSNP